MYRSCFLIVGLLISSDLIAGDSPQFRGPGGEGHSDENHLPLTWSPTENIRWKTDIEGLGWSTPSIAGSEVWLTTAVDQGKILRVICLNKDSGKVQHDIAVFTHEDPGPIHSKNSYASPSVVIDGEYRFVHFGKLGIACLDRTGKTVWKTELKYNHRHGPGGSPVVVGDLLIIACDGTDVQYVTALNKHTGKEVWKTLREGKMAYSTPLLIEVNGQKQLVSTGGEWAMSYAPETGQELWRFRYPAGYSNVPRPVHGEGLVFLCSGYDNPWIYALWQTSRELSHVWLPEVVSGKFDFEGNVRRLLFAVRSAEAGSAIPSLVHKLRDGNVPAELHGPLMETLGQLGGPDDLRLVFDLATASSTAPAQAAAMLSTLAEAKRKRNIQPGGDLGALIQTLTTSDSKLQQAAIDCIGAWKLESLRQSITQMASDPQADLGSRLAAIQGISHLGGEAGKQLLSTLASSNDAEPVRTASITSLIPLDAAAAAVLAVKNLSTSKEIQSQAGIVNSFLQHKGGPDILAGALAQQKLPEDVAKIALRTVTGSGRQEPKLTEALNQAGNIVTAPKMLSKDEMAALVGLIKDKGNAAHGEQIFRRAELNCLKCHAISGAGGKVGPDLVSVGSSAQVDYLVDSILDPNKNVKEGFQSLVVATDDGKVFTGIKVRETETDLLLRDVEDREFAVPLKSIEEQKSGTSLMPVGLVDKLTRSELIDLVRFMSELGKPGPYAAVTARVVRRWETLQQSNETYKQLLRTSDTQTIAADRDLTWVPVFSTVSGALPVQDVRDFTIRGSIALADRKFGFVRCTVNVTTPGEVGVLLNDASGLDIWIDGKPLDPATKLSIPFDVGIHRITFGVNLLTRTNPLRAELVDIDGSKAQAQFVGGK